jgi:HEPN domain-containing protein
MKTHESNPRDWFWLARERLESADALVGSRGVCLSAVELLQESVERYLKGFLIS